MKKIEIYEAAMCCSSGVCGPNIDGDLLRISSVVNQLQNDGIEIRRFNLSDSPQAFIMNFLVNQIIQETGVDDLPITLIDQAVIKKGAYPTNDEFQQWTGLLLEAEKCQCDAECCEDEVVTTVSEALVGNECQCNEEECCS